MFAGGAVYHGGGPSGGRRRQHRLLNIERSSYPIWDLGESRYRDQCVLKGAMLLHVWTAAAHRPTRDLDLLGKGDPSPEHCQMVFRQLCEFPVTTDDGLIFAPESVRVEKIKEGLEYEGVRVKFVARLENARIAIQVDVGLEMP